MVESLIIPNENDSVDLCCILIKHNYACAQSCGGDPFRVQPSFNTLIMKYDIVCSCLVIMRRSIFRCSKIRDNNPGTFVCFASVPFKGEDEMKTI